MQQIVANQPHNQDMSFRDVRQILDEDEALPINPNIPQNVRQLFSDQSPRQIGIDSQTNENIRIVSHPREPQRSNWHENRTGSNQNNNNDISHSAMNSYINISNGES